MGATCFNGVPEFVMYYQDSAASDEQKGLLLAHEFGHFLNLDEAEEDKSYGTIAWGYKFAGNLMNSEHARGPKLLPDQVNAMRASELAVSFAGPAPPQPKTYPTAVGVPRRR